MSKQTQATGPQTDPKARQVKTEPVIGQSNELIQAVPISGEAVAALGGDGSVSGQAASLGRKPWQQVQRQAFAARIGRMQGNRHLQQVVASLQREAEGEGTTEVQPQQAGGDPGIPPQDLSSRIQRAAGQGSTLEEPIQRRLEAGLGADLSEVKVHTDREADTLARSVNAVAFTTGQDIFFREGSYNPQSTEGLRLLAHEATHTVQQSAGPVEGTPTAGGVSISDPDDRFEQAAQQTADTVVMRMAEPLEEAPVAHEEEGSLAQPALQRVPAGTPGGNLSQSRYQFAPVQRAGDPYGRKKASKKAEGSIDIKDNMIKVEGKYEHPVKTKMWDNYQLDILGSIAVSGEVVVPMEGVSPEEATGYKNKISKGVTDTAIREGGKVVWDEQERDFVLVPAEFEYDLEAGGKTDLKKPDDPKSEVSLAVNLKAKWPSGTTAQAKITMLKWASDFSTGKKDTAGLPFTLTGPTIEFEPKQEFTLVSEKELSGWPGSKANLKVTPGLKFVLTPNYKTLAVEMLKKLAPKLLPMLGMEGIAGAMRMLANNPFTWGAYITIKSTMATLEDWHEMKRVASEANGAVDAYTKGYLSSLGAVPSTFTFSPDCTAGLQWAADGAAAGKAALDAQIALIQNHPAFSIYNFTSEELTTAIKEQGPKRAQDILNAIHGDAAAKIKQSYYEQWEQDIGVARKVMDFVFGDDTNKGRNEGEKEAMKALLGLGKDQAAPLLSEDEKETSKPVKRRLGWSYTISGFATGIHVPPEGPFFATVGAIRKDIEAHKSYLESIKPNLEKSGTPVPDFFLNFSVVGYASRTGNEATNSALAKQRAESVSGFLQNTIAGNYAYTATGAGEGVATPTDKVEFDQPKAETKEADIEQLKQQALEEYARQFPNIPEAERRKMVEEKYGKDSNEANMRRVEVTMIWEGYVMP